MIEGEGTTPDFTQVRQRRLVTEPAFIGGMPGVSICTSEVCQVGSGGKEFTPKGPRGITVYVHGPSFPLNHSVKMFCSPILQ